MNNIIKTSAFLLILNATVASVSAKPNEANMPYAIPPSNGSTPRNVIVYQTHYVTNGVTNYVNTTNTIIKK
jgi:hypothetical protein